VQAALGGECNQGGTGKGAPEFYLGILLLEGEKETGRRRIFLLKKKKKFKRKTPQWRRDSLLWKRKKGRWKEEEFGKREISTKRGEGKNYIRNLGNSSHNLRSISPLPLSYPLRRERRVGGGGAKIEKGGVLILTRTKGPLRGRCRLNAPPLEQSGETLGPAAAERGRGSEFLHKSKNQEGAL